MPKLEILRGTVGTQKLKQIHELSDSQKRAFTAGTYNAVTIAGFGESHWKVSFPNNFDSADGQCSYRAWILPRKDIKVDPNEVLP